MKKRFLFPVVGLLGLLLWACSDEIAPQSEPPVLTAGEAEEVTRISATLSGTIRSGAGTAVRQFGLAYSTVSSMPDEETEKVYLDYDAAQTAYTVSLTGLAPSTLYYYCFFATNGINTARSERLSFTTKSASEPVLGAVAVSGITENTLTLSCRFVDEGGSDLKGYGFAYKPVGSDKAELQVNASGKNQEGEFSLTLDELDDTTEYEIRAFAINGVGTGYSEAITTTTAQVAEPVIQLGAVMSDYQSVSLSATLLNRESLTVTEVGFYIGREEHATPDVSDTKHIVELQENTFSVNIPDLEPSTTYYIKAYAVNRGSKGSVTGYSGVTSFVTGRSSLPALRGIEVVLAGERTLTLRDSIADRGGHEITGIGYGLKTSSDAAETLFELPLESLNGDSFEFTLDGLSPNTACLVRTYAVNLAGTGHSEYASVSTSDLGDPAVTLTLDDVTSTSISLTGAVTDKGGASAILKETGFVYSTTNQTPTVDGEACQIIPVETDAPFKATLDGLSQNTTYYIRAYAKNDTRTGYSEVKRGTTLRSTAPTVGGITLSDVKEKSVVLQAQVTDDGGNAITGIGFAWKTGAEPEQSIAVDLSGYSDEGVFKYTLENLLPGTDYQVRAYATNSAGTSYGEYAAFTTAGLGDPAVTLAVDAATPTSISLTGAVTDKGGTSAILKETGFVYSTTNQTPTIDGEACKVVSTGTNNPFGTTLEGLAQNTTYYIRAYAKNDARTGYSEVKTGTTLRSTAPTVGGVTLSDVKEKSVVLQARVTDDGGNAITGIGFAWKTGTEPEQSVAVNLSDYSTDGVFKYTLENLSPGTEYQVRAYATNSVGTNYGEYTAFTTSVLRDPAVTLAVDAATSTSISLTGAVTDKGGTSAILKETGFVYSTTNQTPTIDGEACKVVSTGTNNPFGTTLEGLSQNTTYYIRAYAKNDARTGYSEVKTGTTLRSTAPTVGGVTLSDVKEKSVVLQARVTDDGGNAITGIGFAWKTGTEPEQSVAVNLSDYSTDGVFKYTLENLSPGTEYQVRAYATNSVGTNYGEYTAFTTSGLIPPSLTATCDTLTITGTSFNMAAVITSAGSAGDAVQEVGFVYSTTNSKPTLADTRKRATSWDGTSSAFALNLYNLRSSTTYYVRAYAVNGNMTGYSNVITVTTLTSGAPDPDDNPSPDIK